MSHQDTEVKPSFYRGFWAAEQRKPIVERDPTLGQMIFAGMFSALPVVFVYWLYMRSQVAGAKVSEQMAKPGSMKQMQQMFQKMMNPFGSRNFRVEHKNTSFKDVIGVPEAVAEVKQYVDFLKMPEQFTRLGARLPKGCLLTGEPGTGKTLLAKAVAGESGVPFFTCSGADFIETYSGSGPKRVRELFAEAKAASPSVIFIDEIDAVGSRSNGNQPGSGSSGEENRTVNQLLAEMDGLQGNDMIVIFAATNHPDSIDKALLREGRFDRKIELAIPDRDAREAVFQFALSRVITGDPNGLLKPPADPVASTPTDKSPGSQAAVDVALEAPIEADPAVSNIALARKMASLTPGISPATALTIVNEGALAAAVAQSKYVRESHLLSAIDDVMVGKKHRTRMSQEASRRIALHEAGHAIVAWLLPTQSDVIKISITPRGQAAGFTQQLGRERLEMQTDIAMFTDICVMLGGRIAESSRHQTLTTGAYDDLQRATKTAVTKFLALGMSARVGLLSFDHNRIDNGRMYQRCSEATQRCAETEAHALIKEAFAFTTAIVAENQQKLNELVELLITKQEVLHEDLVAVLGPRPAASNLDPRVRTAMNRFIRQAEDAGSRIGAAREDVSEAKAVTA